jgi:voltage-gated potassium channel
MNKISDIIPLKGKTLNRNLSRLFESMIIFLILADVILLTLISFLHVSPEVYLIIVFFDLTVVFILIPEFLYRLWKADNRKKFLKENGIEIIGMVPEILVGHYSGYILYFRLIRIAVLFKKEIRHVYNFLDKTHINHGIFAILIILFSGTIIFYIVEHGQNPQMAGMDDALWYMVVTITTVGYGDISAQTNAGRLVGVVIMFAGIGFISFLTATITSIFIKDTEKEEMDKIDVLHEKIDSLENEIKQLKEILKEK